MNKTFAFTLSGRSRMQVGSTRRRHKGVVSVRARKRPRHDRDCDRNAPKVVSHAPIPALPSDVWMLIARRCDLQTKAVVSQICREASLAVCDMPNLQLARGVIPDICGTDALPFARTLRILVDLLVLAPCSGNDRSSAVVLRALAGEGSAKSEAYVSSETVRFFLGLKVIELPPGTRARNVAVPRKKCCVQHKGPVLEHAPGYRVECAYLHKLSDVIRVLVRKKGIQGVVEAVIGAKAAVEVLEKRKMKGMQARKIVDDMLTVAGLDGIEVEYIMALETIQDALFGLEHPGLIDVVQRAIAVHKAIRPRYVWLWRNDGKARRKATLFLKKGIARRMDTRDLVRYMEGKFWWVTNHIATMPLHMRLAEENDFGPFEPVSPADSSASSGADNGLQIPYNVKVGMLIDAVLLNQ